MISDDKMNKVAVWTVENAPNPDWLKEIEKVGDSRTDTVKNFKDEVLGEATVAYYRFLHPKQPRFDYDSPFNGFTIAVMEVGKKTIHNSYPVHGELDEDDWKATCRLEHRFCPECHGVDTVKQKTGRRGREWAEIIYSCKCGYRDVDVMD